MLPSPLGEAKADFSEGPGFGFPSGCLKSPVTNLVEVQGLQTGLLAEERACAKAERAEKVQGDWSMVSRWERKAEDLHLSAVVSHVQKLYQQGCLLRSLRLQCRDMSGGR